MLLVLFEAMIRLYNESIIGMRQIDSSSKMLGLGLESFQRFIMPYTYLLIILFDNTNYILNVYNKLFISRINYFILVYENNYKLLK